MIIGSVDKTAETQALLLLTEKKENDILIPSQCLEKALEKKMKKVVDNSRQICYSNIAVAKNRSYRSGEQMRVL